MSLAVFVSTREEPRNEAGVSYKVFSRITIVRLLGLQVNSSVLLLISLGLISVQETSVNCT